MVRKLHRIEKPSDAALQKSQNAIPGRKVAPGTEFDISRAVADEEPWHRLFDFLRRGKKGRERQLLLERLVMFK
jgi:hypothetical protein